MRPWSIRHCSRRGLPQHSAAENQLRSPILSSGPNRKNGYPHEKLVGGSVHHGGASPRVTAALAIQPNSTFEFRGPGPQPTQDVDCKPVDLLLLEDPRGPRQPQLAILVLILAVTLMAAPSLIAGMALLNNAIVLSQGSSRPDLDLSSVAVYARVLVGVALAFTVVRSPREQ